MLFMAIYGSSHAPLFDKYLSNMRGIQNYWQNAIDGNTVDIRFLNIFCYGKFHIYLAKSPFGSENKTYA